MLEQIIFPSPSLILQRKKLALVRLLNMPGVAQWNRPASPHNLSIRETLKACSTPKTYFLWQPYFLPLTSLEVFNSRCIIELPEDILKV